MGYGSGAVTIGPFAIHWYGVFIAFALALGPIWLTWKPEGRV